MIDPNSETWHTVMQWADEKEQELLQALRSLTRDHDYDVFIKGRLAQIEALKSLPESFKTFISKPIM